MLAKSANQYFRQQRSVAGLTCVHQRNFSGGGPKKPSMPASETNFDIVFVGGMNSTAILKFLQCDGVNYKMALITDRSRFILPQSYFGVSHGHIAELKLESSTVSAQIEPWSRMDTFAKVSQFVPEQNKLRLTNGREYTYKALVMATGFNHTSEHIEGLRELELTPQSNVFVHAIDNKERIDRNYYHGWNHTNGDMICYSPKFPYKGEGSDFYALYYEHFLRQDILQGRAAKNARIQYWTPNKEIFKFGYANEVALEECKKRGIEVFFGWEMIKVATNEHGQKIATFRNVDTGVVIEKDFFSACINPPSKPHQELLDSGIANSEGVVDVNPYTLQHKRFENIFAFGDCIGVNTTRTQSAVIHQSPVIQHNIKQFMEGKELNAIYDGYTFMPFLMGHSYATNFQHLYDFEPHALNHMIPQYGLMARWYFGRMMKSQMAMGEKFTSFKKTHGPPYYNWNPRYVPLEHNDYLISRNIPVSEVRMFEPKVRVAHEDHH